MSHLKPIRRSTSSNQSINSTTTNKKTTIFPLPNATKPRYVVPKKIEINELPDDILLYIFRYLSPIDLLKIGIICRRWHSISQDESLWRSLVFSYGLHQVTSTLTNKQRIQAYLNQQINTQLKTLFSTKFDVLKSYTGIPNYEKIFTKFSQQFKFLLAFCDDKHNVIWSQKCETIKFFEVSMSIRWFEITKPELLTRVRYLRLFSIVSININTRPNRTRLPKENEQLSDVTQKPIQHTQQIQSLLHEYTFDWNLFEKKSISLTNDIKSSIRISRLSNEDDLLIGYYEQDKSFAFLVFNINYLSFHELFFTGLRLTTLTNNKSLSHMMIPNHFPKSNDIEVSVFICFRNMTTIFLRHRFLNCRLINSNTRLIELLRITDMAKELGPELHELPKFNWKTGIFKGTINDLFLIDIVVLNERKNVSFSVTLPATLISGDNDNEGGQGKDYLLSSNVWNIKAESQCNNQLRINGTIMRLDSEYCALGRDTQSWHLQNMTCSF
ncbi:unnamed protein product [Adineta steineri]|uniref:F-box domain-containing protein n=1 Tax=Adineta steineri TaxID=433720 RepID=A0A814PUS2_9BILA|nr:unnamed protein product [Adineta steineri]CAF1111125.1 unnamed protein product [Adineta steineri]